MYRTLLTLLFTASTLWSLGQQGTIAGTITSNEGGRPQPMPFVNVVIKGTTTGATTDLDGKFSFQADPGEHVLAVSFVGFQPEERNVTVTTGERTTVDIELRSQAVEMKAVEVVSVRRTETESAVLMETRKSEQVVNGIGRQQIAKSQDRSAGDVVKRVPGVTLIGNRFVMVRGLADRYNTVQLNDVTAPSLEADRRAFSFDILPSGALDRVLIFKTGSADLPGEFAGGVVKLYTVNVPNENITKVGLSTSYRSGTTFDKFYTSTGSPTDALGFDDGYRKLPDAFPADLSTVTDPATLQNAGRSLPNNWATKRTNAAPDGRFDLLIARRFGKDDAKVTGGTLTALSYSNTRSAYTANNYNYNTYDPIVGHSDTIYSYKDNENIQQARISALHNWTALIGNGTKLDLRNLFTQQGTEQTTLRTGRDLEGGSQVRNYAYRYEQRTIYSGQLHGSHDLKTDVNKLDWTLGYGLATGQEPDYRRIRTVRDIHTTEADVPYEVIVPPGASTLDAGRFYSELHEHIYTGKLDFEQRVGKPDAKVGVKLRVGGFAEMKDRSFDARWMSFKKASTSQFDQSLLDLPLEQVFTEEHINNTTGFKLEEGTNPSDRYDAANHLYAGYLSGTFVFSKLFTLSAGARAEHNTQELTSTTYSGRRIRINNPVLSILPSLNANYNVTERALVRAGYAMTVNRPEFRELAPFSFYDFSTNNVLFGNDSLRTATIQNVDARWEYYPGAGEIISAGAFYKSFADPIELYFVPGAGSGGTRNFTFRNAESAMSIGAEVEFRRSLASMGASGALGRFSLLLNATYIYSRVQLGDQAKGQSSERPMMGQSPYVLNGGIYFEQAEHKLQFNLLYNVFGRRLYAVGTTGTPDIYEMPRSTVDATVTKGLGKHFEVKLSAQDILNQRTRLMQDSNEDGTINDQDEEILGFRRGTYFSLGIGFTL
ncbi:MAG: carboxypeptidase-like regulatory domain-containing protein [Flavobacteriales bacterium]|nr:carboxypeptidase-like regulatory domain-containing protein [Flavobacteriales bacterium]